MAAISLTLTVCVRVSPTALNSRSWMTRSSLAWIDSGMLPTSSRNSVPPFATSNRPRLFATAPVNEPLTWPKSSLSSRFSLSDVQSTGTNDRSLRRLL